MNGIRDMFLILFLIASCQAVSYRLPNTAIPSNYDLFFSPVIEKKSFTGRVSITLDPEGITNNITLHADVNVTSVKLNGLTMSFEIAKNDTNFMVVKNVKNLNANSKLDIEFNGQLRDDMLGFYYSSYDTKKALAASKFEPTYARKAFPCFDEPHLKATFTVEITRPPNYNGTYSNTPVESSASNKIKFKKTTKMSTYLVAFIVSEFEEKRNSEKFGVQARSSALNQLQYGLEQLEPLVKVLNNFTGIDYFKYMSKIDMVAVPDFMSGAMENWGLITYRETNLLYDAKESSVINKQTVTGVIAHELSHMWFGNLVTLSWWDYLWLNEGFATYCEAFIPALIHPEWQLEEQFVADTLQAIMVDDGFKIQFPLTNPVKNPIEIRGNFRSVTYKKGGSIVRMAEHILGRDVFLKGIRNYLSKHKQSVATPKSLWDSFDFPGLAGIMAEWTDKPGFPVVIVSKKGTKITLTQELFKYGEIVGAKSNWTIPINYIGSNGGPKSTEPMYWFNGTQPELEIDIGKNDWVVLNVDQTGYYRVNYGSDMWRKIGAALNKGDFSGIGRLNRAQIVDDAFNLARAGRIAYDVAFETTKFLKHETEFVVWLSALRNYNFLLNAFPNGTDTGDLLKEHLSSLMGAIKNATESQSIPQTDVDIMNKAQIMSQACFLGDKKCIEHCLSAYKLYRNSNSSVDPNTRRTIFCEAIKNGTEDDWNFIWKKYITTTFPSTKGDLIAALTCSTNPEQHKKLLEKVVKGPEIRAQDTTQIYVRIASSRHGVNPAFDYLKSDFVNISNRLGEIANTGKVLTALAGHLRNRSEEFKKLLEDMKTKLPNIASYADSAVELMETNQKWVQDNGNQILKYLEKEKDSTGSASTFVSTIILTISTIVVARLI